MFWLAGATTWARAAASAKPLAELLSLVQVDEGERDKYREHFQGVVMGAAEAERQAAKGTDIFSWIWIHKVSSVNCKYFPARMALKADAVPRI